MHAPWPDERPVNAMWLDLADRGLLDYDHDRYRIHGVPNNVLALIWGGLIADHPDGPRLTDTGRARLAAERAHDNHDTGAHRPDAMPPQAAAWIREHVWPPTWLRNHQHIPGTFTHCACHKPPSAECQRGRHTECRDDNRPTCETVIQTAAPRPATPIPTPTQARSTPASTTSPGCGSQGRPAAGSAAAPATTRPRSSSRRPGRPGRAGGG
ncbi:hypothetical protein [Kitasatospora griseola]|uniref:hypothetical protein n=1 Tax=Kitasatospora griseola TaxID=2064 RepID=UPI0016717B1B|nr:hypothetical protein [Kitasatospora griseola]GGR04404.1 hypothetical protein GCM10010195_69860 [Kitasatospora griseola]